MQKNMQLTQQYKELKSNMAKEQQAKEREREAMQNQLRQERVELEKRLETAKKVREQPFDSPAPRGAGETGIDTSVIDESA